MKIITHCLLSDEDWPEHSAPNFNIANEDWYFQKHKTKNIHRTIICSKVFDHHFILLEKFPNVHFGFTIETFRITQYREQQKKELWAWNQLKFEDLFNEQFLDFFPLLKD